MMILGLPLNTLRFAFVGKGFLWLGSDKDSLEGEVLTLTKTYKPDILYIYK